MTRTQISNSEEWILRVIAVIFSLLAVAIFSGALYGLIRFVKWAWSD